MDVPLYVIPILSMPILLIFSVIVLYLVAGGLHTLVKRNSERKPANHLYIKMPSHAK